MAKSISRGRLEKEIEKTILDSFPEIMAIKLHLRDWPDRLFLLPGGRCFFVEFKRPEGVLRPGQHSVIEELRKRGFTVYIINDVIEGLRLIERELLGIV